MVKTTQQSGVALIVLMLLILTAASFALLVGLNSTTSRLVRDSSSMAALQEAKTALIGYAVTYADAHPGYGPGFLPCPDIRGSGAAGGSCALAPHATTIGRLPYKTLDIPKMTDHSSEVLWYALSDNYRNNPKGVLNSDTPGNFTVDAADDIVALVFAPGPPVAAQVRGTRAERLNVANYLEGDNADNDASFVTVQEGADHANFNDRLLTITRQELMQVVEKRVLGDVAKAVLAYREQYGAYPWLSPFDAPAHSEFQGQVGQRQGRLAYHEYESGQRQAAKIKQPNPKTALVDCLAALKGSAARGSRAGKQTFLARPSLSWQNLNPKAVKVIRETLRQGMTVEDMSIYDSPMLSDACQTNSAACKGGRNFSEIKSLIAPEAVKCHWPDAQICRYVDPKDYQHIVSCDEINFTIREEAPVFHTDRGRDGSCSPIILPPEADALRRRDVSLTAAKDSRILPHRRAYRVLISNILNGELYNHKTHECDSGPFEISANMYFYPENITQGKITVHNIPYNLDVGRGELPPWFIKNNWQPLIYLAYAGGEPLPGDPRAGQDCGQD